MTTPARISDDGKGIIDSDGKQVAFDDPRVVHVNMSPERFFSSRATGALYERRGRRYRTFGKTTLETLRVARQLCSGRECLPFVAMTGNMLHDLTTRRTADEITVYFCLNQEGPCQNGAWPVIWETFVTRLAARNVLFPPNAAARDVLGLDLGLSLSIFNTDIVGPLLEEAHGALRVVAADREAALRIFKEETEAILQSLVSGSPGIDAGLDRWADRLARVPRRVSLEEAPKVLVIGGLNLGFVAYPFIDGLIEFGVIPKVVDMNEGMALVASEPIMRYGLEHGIVEPRAQFASLEKIVRTPEVSAALTANTFLGYLEKQGERVRTRMARSGLLFDRPVPFRDIIEKGHTLANCNSLNETTVTAGRYRIAIEQGFYDGVLNLGTFNCQPAMNSHAVIRPLANTNDLPYVAIDVDGPWMTGNQRRLLETLAVGARRRRAATKHG